MPIHLTNQAHSIRLHQIKVISAHDVKPTLAQRQPKDANREKNCSVVDGIVWDTKFKDFLCDFLRKLIWLNLVIIKKNGNQTGDDSRYQKQIVHRDEIKHNNNYNKENIKNYYDRTNQ